MSDHHDRGELHSARLLPCASSFSEEVVEGNHDIIADGTGVEPYTPWPSPWEAGLIRWAHEWAVAPPRCDPIVAPRARPCSAQCASCRIGPLDGGLPPEARVIPSSVGRVYGRIGERSANVKIRYGAANDLTSGASAAMVGRIRDAVADPRTEDYARGDHPTNDRASR